MKLPQVEFTSPTEWNPDTHDDSRTTDEMIRQFPAVPLAAVNEFYDLKGNVNYDYLRRVKSAEIAVDKSDDNDISDMPELQEPLIEDSSGDDDSDHDNEPTKTSTTMQWKIPIDDSDAEKFPCQRIREQRAKRNAKCLINHQKRAAVKKELI
jgi:hypothetical protein